MCVPMRILCAVSEANGKKVHYMALGPRKAVFTYTAGDISPAISPRGFFPPFCWFDIPMGLLQHGAES